MCFGYNEESLEIIIFMEKIKDIILEIINTFPKSKNGQPYLTLQSWKKLFLSVFIKKYWLRWEKTKYSDKDILRRMRMVEFFDYITKNYQLIEDESQRYILETVFFRMIIVKTKKDKLELISFYNFK